MIIQNKLPFFHSWYHVTTGEGVRVDPLTTARPVTVHDADDYSHYVEEGECRWDLAASTRWEKRAGRVGSYFDQVGDEVTLYVCYFTNCFFSNSNFAYCVMYDVAMNMCSLNNCHVHFTRSTDVTNCNFNNCVLTTSSNAGLVYCDSKRLFNCTLRGYFAEEEGRSDLQMTAANPYLTQIAPFDVHSNIVLKDIIVDCLRRYMWHFRKRQAIRRKRFNTAAYMPQTRTNSEADLKQPVPNEQQAWRAKTAGKQPLEINSMYDATEQLDMPARRCEWSVDRSPERPKKRKIDMTGVNLDN